MKRRLDILLLAGVSLLCFSCKKFSNGNVTEKQYQLDPPFQAIEMCDNINVTLKHADAVNPAGKIIVKTGENLIDQITTEFEEQSVEVTHNEGIETLVLNKLVIRNENTLDFLRPYDYTLEMTVYYDSLLMLIFNSNGIISTDTLRGYDSWTDFSNDSGDIIYSLTPNLMLEINGGSGDFTVLTNCYRLITKYMMGTSSINVKGSCVRAETYGNYDCHGIINCLNMESSLYHRINYFGTNTVYAKAFKQIIAMNDNIGRVFYARYTKPGKVIHWGYLDPDEGWIPSDTVDTTYYCPLSLVKSGLKPENILDTIISRP